MHCNPSSAVATALGGYGGDRFAWASAMDNYASIGQHHHRLQVLKHFAGGGAAGIG
jgi:hypothetical protein